MCVQVPKDCCDSHGSCTDAVASIESFLVDTQRQILGSLIDECFPEEEADNEYDYYAESPWMMGENDGASTGDGADADDDVMAPTPMNGGMGGEMNGGMGGGMDGGMGGGMDGGMGLYDYYEEDFDGYDDQVMSTPPRRLARRLTDPPEAYANRFCPGQTGEGLARHTVTMVEATMSVSGYSSRTSFTPLAREAFIQAIAESCGDVSVSSVHITSVRPGPKLLVSFAVSRAPCVTQGLPCNACRRGKINICGKINIKYINLRLTAVFICR
jgi:hypothetical protein